MRAGILSGPCSRVNWHSRDPLGYNCGMNQRRRPRDSANAGTLLALLALLMVAGGLLGLTVMVMPRAIGFLAVLVGFFCFGALHYLLWGWWLKPDPGDDPDEPGAD